MLKLKRAYGPPSSHDGQRFLVERLWPRGVRKEALRLKAWLKEIAPSAELRKWFNHDPRKWPEFQKRYRAELNQHPETLDPLIQEAQRGNVTFVYSSHESECNCASVLRDYLESKLNRKPSRAHKPAA